MLRYRSLLVALVLPLLAAPASAAAQRPSDDIVVIDASRFAAEIQKDHVLTDAASLREDWIFNNTALEMRTRSNYVLRAEIPRAGRYHLYFK